MNLVCEILVRTTEFSLLPVRFVQNGSSYASYIIIQPVFLRRVAPWRHYRVYRSTFTNFPRDASNSLISFAPQANIVASICLLVNFIISTACSVETDAA